MTIKRIVKELLYSIGFDVRRAYSIDPSIPDAAFYRPLFSPWDGFGNFKSYYEAARPFTVVSPDRCYVLYTLAFQALHLDGQWYEAGVYRGGTAILLAKLLEENERHEQTKLHLFDTFEGMPETDPRIDRHKKDDFKDTSLEAIRSRLESSISDLRVVEFHQGMVPATFENLTSHQVSFAHVDVDIYRSIKDCCEFIYPRLQNGGFMVFDDYGFPTCPGARKAVDEFFEDKPEFPLVLPTGQAVVFRAKNENRVRGVTEGSG